MNELDYRISRIDKLEKHFEGKRIHKLMYAISLPSEYLPRFQLAILVYCSAALDVAASDADSLMQAIDDQMFSKNNVTPNGGIVPKNEYQFEYNLVLKSWSEIFHFLNKDFKVFSKVRIFPSVRLKEGKKDLTNQARPFRTELPHSDSWVDGYWGLNIHMPFFGDFKNNCLQYFYLNDDSLFSSEMLGPSKSFEEMQWVLDKCKVVDGMQAPPNHLCVSDYLLLHNTKRADNAKSRISLDSSCVIGNHSYKDDDDEFVNEIPRFGVENMYLTTTKSGTIIQKKNSSQGFSNLGALVKKISYK